MENIYLFTKGNFVVQSCNGEYLLNKNSHLKLNKTLAADFVDIINSEISCNKKRLYFNAQENSNYFKIYTNQNNKFIEIVSSDFSNLVCKLTHNKTEVYIYDYSIRLIYKNKCYTCTYAIGETNNLICDNDKILIFNENILLEFNTTNLIFNILNIEKYEKNDKKIEILCKIPHNFNYFLFFDINLEKNKYTTEKYKKTTRDTNQIVEPFFYLAKYGFEDGKNYLTNLQIFQDCCKYFSGFDSLHNFDNKFYATKHNNISEIIFSIKDNKIIDID